MNHKSQRLSYLTALSLCVLAARVLHTQPLFAQNEELQQKVEQIKQATAQNKKSLAQYTWVEQVTISLKGTQKKQERFQVVLWPDGTPEETSLDQPAFLDSGGIGSHMRKRVEKKKEEFEEYADQIKSLIRQYVPPDKDMLQQAYQRGNIMMGPHARPPGEFRLAISNYIKQGDNMTLVIDEAQKDLVSVSIATYIDEPSDEVTVSAQFTGIPGGPHHVSSETINGVKKQLTIVIQNSDYQKL